MNKQVAVFVDRSAVAFAEQGGRVFLNNHRRPVHRMPAP